MNSHLKRIVCFIHSENSEIVRKLTILWWMFIWLSKNGMLNVILALISFSQ